MKALGRVWKGSKLSSGGGDMHLRPILRDADQGEQKHIRS